MKVTSYGFKVILLCAAHANSDREAECTCHEYKTSVIADGVRTAREMVENEALEENSPHGVRSVFIDAQQIDV